RYRPLLHLHSLLFLIFINRPPPTSPLFPYTTLFRSDVAVELELDDDLRRGEHAGRGHRGDAGDGGELLLELGRHRGTHDLRHHLDRKSTRLNSSHLGISYAVFCLKKKNKKIKTKIEG